MPFPKTSCGCFGNAFSRLAVPIKYGKEDLFNGSPTGMEFSSVGEAFRLPRAINDRPYNFWSSFF